MVIKMWSLVDKKTGKLISVFIFDAYVVGFTTKKGLMHIIGSLEQDEEIRKIEVEV